MVRNGALSKKETILQISKSQRTLKSHYWFKSYGDFAEWVDFSYWTNVVKLVGEGSVINGAYNYIYRKII